MKVTYLLAFIMSVASFPLLYAEPNLPDELSAIGSFSDAEGDGDHTVGHEFSLWHQGSNLIGQVRYWGGQQSAAVGEFSDGKYDPKSGKVSFQFVLNKGNAPADGSTGAGTFNGIIKRDSVSGKLDWTGEVAKFIEGGSTQLNLPRQTDVELKTFPNLKAWSANEYSRRNFR